MSVLLAIGRFFKKIWDWIKQTAWIQPLLIVGIIFGVITSIRPIIDLAKTNKEKRNEYNTFFVSDNRKLSLKGAEEGNSEAGTFTSELYNIVIAETEQEETAALEKFKNDYGDKCGEKFFLAYVEKECSNCDAAKEAFAFFKNNYLPEGDEFHLVTIFGDEEKYSDSKPDDTPFYYYCLDYNGFFNHAADVARESAYFTNEKISLESITTLYEADNTNFFTPTFFLIELGEDIEKKGVTEVMIGFPPELDDKYKRAQQLADCWNHKGDFTDNESDKH